METRRLRLLVEFARLGSMRAVAAEMHVTTSTVSQQLAVLAREAGTALIEPDGRRARLTPAGRRLAAHAVTILAAVETARLDLDPGAEPAGELRVASFATAVRRDLLPIMAELGRDHPRVRLRLAEHEPFEAYALLAGDAVDLALTYDYDLAPATLDPALESEPLWRLPWSLAVPSATTAHDLAGLRDADWIVNSRNTAEEDVIRALAARHGYAPRIAHRVDSLELVQELIVAGLGVALLPAGLPTLPGVRLQRLADPPVMLRCHAVTRRGRAGWPPLALVLRRLRGRHGAQPSE